MIDAQTGEAIRIKTIFASGYLVGARGFFDPPRPDMTSVFKAVYQTGWLIGQLDFGRTGYPESEEMAQFRLKVAWDHYTSLMAKHSADGGDGTTNEKWAAVFGNEIAICDTESLARAERRKRNEPEAALITLRLVEGSLGEQLSQDPAN